MTRVDLTLPDLFRSFPLPLSAALIAGLVLPLLGSFLFVRRTSFYGIVLPQFGAAGVAFAFVLLPWWIANVGIGDLDLPTALDSPARITPYLFGWSVVASFVGLGFLSLPGGQAGSESGRVAAGFALASAGTLLLANSSPTGAEFVEVLIHGQMLAIGTFDFGLLCALALLLAAAVLVFQRDLLLVSYDPETARVLGKPVRAFELLLAALTGITVSVGVMTVGPVVLFGNLVLPPLAARGFARSWRGMLLAASGIGGASACVGIVLSFEFDWPLGPAIVAALAPWVLVGWLAGRLRA